MQPAGLVFRTRPWPVDDLRGKFIVTREVLEATSRVLMDYGQLEGFGHEGLVFWCGHRCEEVTAIVQVVAPATDHGPGHVSADRDAVGLAARAARGAGLGIVAQVHSHPGGDGRHSDGDDELILLPFEGMLSIVIPNFGASFSAIDQACVHQFQAGQWVLCRHDSVAKGFRTASALVDQR